MGFPDKVPGQSRESIAKWCSSCCWPRTEMVKVPWGSLCLMRQCVWMCYSKQHGDAIGGISWFPREQEESPDQNAEWSPLSQPSLATSRSWSWHPQLLHTKELQVKSSHSLSFPAVHVSQLSYIMPNTMYLAKAQLPPAHKPYLRQSMKYQWKSFQPVLKKRKAWAAYHQSVPTDNHTQIMESTQSSLAQTSTCSTCSLLLLRFFLGKINCSGKQCAPIPCTTAHSGILLFFHSEATTPLFSTTQGPA